MDDDQSCVATNFLKLNSNPNEHNRHIKNADCVFFAFLRGCTGV